MSLHLTRRIYRHQNTLFPYKHDDVFTTNQTNNNDNVCDLFVI